MVRRLLYLITLFISTISLTAQLDTADFRWDFADLAFSYPAYWDDPFAVQQFGIESVLIAESGARDPDRTPETPIIIMALTPITDDTTPESILLQRLADFGMQSAVTIPTDLLNQVGVYARGSSSDETLFGIGVSIPFEDNILTIIGRTASDHSESFEYAFDIVTRSLVQGQEFGNYVPFGLVWDNSADILDNETAFLDLRALALDETNQALYALDSGLGVLRFDRVSGQLEAIIPNIEFVTPTTLSIGTSQTVYVGDIGCRCIHVYQDNEWQETFDGFAEASPFSIATTTDGTLYATDSDGVNIFVRRYSPEGTSNLFSEEPLSTQPILFIMDEQLHFLDGDTNEIYQLDGVGFALVTMLNADIIIEQINVTPDGTFVIVQEEFIDLYTFDSLLIDTIDINDYSVGSFITGLAVGADSTLYVATQDENVGEVLALSQRVRDTQIGLQMLAPYRTSGGFLNEDNPEDIWLIEGEADEVLSLFVHGESNLGDFRYSMSFFAPDGTEIVTIEDDTDQPSPLDRGFQDLILPDTGIYEVHINHIFSQGSYDITPVTVKQIELQPDTTELWGELSESYGQEMWAFEAPAGTILTFTLEAAVPTELDPYMLLFDSRYNLLGQNDDAEDNQLGNSTQIANVTLPRNDVYYIDALTLSGNGKYRLTIEIVEPTN